MVYQDVKAPAAVLNREITLTRNFFAALAEKLGKFGSALAISSSAQNRFDYVQTLQGKSNAELAEMGVKRGDIVHHVFRDLYYS